MEDNDNNQREGVPLDVTRWSANIKAREQAGSCDRLLNGKGWGQNPGGPPKIRTHTEVWLTFLVNTHL